MLGSHTYLLKLGLSFKNYLSSLSHKVCMVYPYQATGMESVIRKSLALPSEQSLSFHSAWKVGFTLVIFEGNHNQPLSCRFWYV